jgi:hypothetical protein
MRTGIWTCALASLLALCTSGPAQAGDDLDWDPESTSVFIVGILEWERSDLWSPFPDAMVDRRDQQLVEFFRDAGVPDERIVYLQDSEATKSRIKKRLVALLDETDEGELVVIYFAGHGYRDNDSGDTWFACYDVGDENESGWSVKEIFDAVENHFSGDRALLLADCCHSGALYDEARERAPESDVAYGVITSSYAHNTSTGNWTFTDSLLAGWRGDGLCDLNGDDYVSLREIARYAELELAFIEGQKSMFYASSDFPRDAALAPTADEPEARVGERIEVEWRGKWFRAKSIDADGDQLLVHYNGFDSETDEWVGPERVRPYYPAQFAEGDRVEVEWEKDGKWYPARIERGWYGLHKVRYDGYDETSDEWVGPGKVRLRSE